MAYKKPQIVAKSVAKHVFVAGCPTNSGSSICQKHAGCKQGPLS